MLNAKAIEDVVQQVAATLPAGVRVMREDVERNVRAGIQSAFQRMDLVTREEFEVQAALLARSIARIEELEARVVQVEAAAGLSGASDGVDRG